MALLANIRKAGTALVSSTQGWGQKILNNVFPKSETKPTAKLTNETVEQLDNAMKAQPGNNFFQLPQWQKSQVVDLTETSKLPNAYETPKRAQLVKVAPGAIDNPESIVNDKKFRDSIPKKGLVVQEVITKKQILNLLQNEPSKLTKEMVQVLIGEKEGFQGLNPRDVAAALQRMEFKFQGDESKLPNPDLRSMLIHYVIGKGSESLAKEVTSLKGLHNNTGYEALVRTDERTQEDKTKFAIDLINKKTTKNLESSNINTSGGLVEKMYQAAKKSIIENANAGARHDLTAKDKKDILARNFKDIRAEITKDKLADFDKAILKMVHELETMYENGGNNLSRSYSRITKLNSGINTGETDDRSKEVVLGQETIDKASKAKINLGFKESVALGVESLPYSFLQMIVDDGKKLHVGQSMQALGKEGTINGDHHKRGFENTPGLCDADGNAFITAEYIDPSRFAKKTTGSKTAMAAARHELGYVFLRILESKKPEIANQLFAAYENDLADLKAKHGSIQKAMSYQVQENPDEPGVATKKGFSEAFAYSVANSYGGDIKIEPFRFNNLERMITKLGKQLDKESNTVGNKAQLAQRIIKDVNFAATSAA